MLIDDGKNIAYPGKICIANDNVMYDEFISKALIIELLSEANVDLSRFSVTMNGPYKNTEIRLNEITNQPGWTLDPAGVSQALSDLNDWIVSESGGGPGGPSNGFFPQGWS